MITVIFYNVCVGWSGTERYLYNLVKGMDRGRFMPRILIPDSFPDKQAAFIERFETLDVKVTVFPYQYNLPTRSKIIWFYKYFTLLNRDIKSKWVLHFNQANPGANAIEIISAKLARVPAVVATNHLPLKGLPLSILEAMVAQKPVIATDVGGVRDAVIHMRTGMLVPPRNPSLLAQAIDYLLKNPEESQRMAITGYNRAQELFGLERMVRETQQLYEELFL